jgi:hypothetical protein
VSDGDDDLPRSSCATLSRSVHNAFSLRGASHSR